MTWPRYVLPDNKEQNNATKVWEGLRDEQSKAYWASIKDPVEALRAIIDGSQYFGYDPYYSDLYLALFKIAERVVYESEKTNGKD